MIPEKGGMGVLILFLIGGVVVIQITVVKKNIYCVQKTSVGTKANQCTSTLLLIRVVHLVRDTSCMRKRS